MPIIAVREAQDRLLTAGLAFDADFNGCTEREIRSIEGHFGIQLPKSYREFLSVMGRGGGLFLAGSDYSFPKMLGFRDEAQKLLQRCQPAFQLPATAFVYFSHQGYNYLWFDCSQGSDPSVFLYTEMEPEPRQVSDSFSNWLLGAVDDDISAYREIGGHNS